MYSRVGRKIVSTQPNPKPADPAALATAFNDMITGLRKTQLLYVAAKLGIADLLQEGAKSSDELAHAVGAHPRALYRVLRALAGLGVFAETPEGRFALTPLATLLQSGVPGSQRASAIWWGERWQWQAYGALLYSVQTNRSAFEHAHGMPFYTYMDQHADAAASFNAWMMSATAPDAATIATAYDFSRIATLIDVGGGQGVLLTTLLHAYPQMRGVLFDLPTVVEGAREAMASAGVADRCTLAAGDFFTEVPRGGDAYTLKQVIHNWDDARAIALLKNCRQAMAPGARLLLIERIIAPDHGPAPALLDITVLVNTGAGGRTEAEYRVLLTAAGFTLTTIVPTLSGLSIIEGAPV
jgi:hypothetical protein